MSYIIGEVTYRLYFDSESFYSVYKVKIEDTDLTELKYYDTCSVTGYFSELDINSSYRFEGELVESLKYGYSFKANKFERMLPSTIEGIIEFLSGDNFKGIGYKKAKLVVDELKEDTIKKILEDKTVLDNIKGLSEANKESIITGIENSREVEEIMIALYSYGISPKLSMRIYDKYASETLNVIKNEPYRLIDDVDGIAFLKADKIALSIGINPKSQKRVEACIKYVIFNDAFETGNTLIEEELLKEKVKKYLMFNKDDEYIISDSLENLILRRTIIRIGTTLSYYALYNAEESIARKLNELNNVKTNKLYDEEIERIIKRVEDELSIEYEETQKEAIITALKNNVSIITGGPGTGKTTIERGIIRSYLELVDSNLDNVALCAPTGKAAKRIEETTGLFSQTIHRTLGLDRNGKYAYNKLNKLSKKLCVIDEASMIDTFLFEALLDALPNDCKIVIVGDSDQLPSIEPGQVLKDLIESNAFKVTRLTRVHRQKRDSKIISLASDILDEKIETELDENHDELQFINSTTKDLFENLKTTINHFSGLGYNLLEDIQVLIPMYKGNVGIDAVNKYLQREFNHNYNIDEDEGLETLFIDDKVIQLVNQYEDSVMNGDMGYIADVLGKKELIADFQGNLVKYKGIDIYNLQLAYSISIHKSQGSEFKVVILPIFNQYMSLLNKKLLYTAVTRAKEYLVIIGDFRALNRAMSIHSEQRKTRLKDMI